MKISAINKQNMNRPVAFAGNEETLYQRLTQAEVELKQAIKAKANEETLRGIQEKLSNIEKEAKKALGTEKIPSVFVKILKWFGKVDKTGNKALDTASMLTKVVLWGNVGKELVGTGLYTVQALTNQDLPEDKRKFVGMYDLAVGLVSTAFSFMFGVGLEKTIKNGYKKILKPISEAPNPAMRSRASVAIVGLAAFSSFALQTIIGKRIVAPAVATPVAGRLKKYMEEKSAEKNGIKQENKSDDNMSPFPAEALILAKTPESSETNLLKQRLDKNA